MMMPTPIAASHSNAITSFVSHPGTPLAVSCTPAQISLDVLAGASFVLALFFAGRSRRQPPTLASESESTEPNAPDFVDADTMAATVVASSDDTTDEGDVALKRPRTFSDWATLFDSECRRLEQTVRTTTQPGAALLTFNVLLKNVAKQFQCAGQDANRVAQAIRNTWRLLQALDSIHGRVDVSQYLSRLQLLKPVITYALGAINTITDATERARIEEGLNRHLEAIDQPLPSASSSSRFRHVPVAEAFLAIPRDRSSDDDDSADAPSRSRGGGSVFGNAVSRSATLSPQEELREAFDKAWDSFARSLAVHDNPEALISQFNALLSNLLQQFELFKKPVDASDTDEIEEGVNNALTLLETYRSDMRVLAEQNLDNELLAPLIFKWRERLRLLAIKGMVNFSWLLEQKVFVSERKKAALQHFIESLAPPRRNLK